MLKPTGRRERVWCVQVPAGAILIRRNGKVCVQGNCNFGLIYGQSAPGLVRYAAASYGVHLDPDEAREIRAAFFRTYGHLRQWHGESHQQAERGVTEVRTRLGRRRLIPETATEWERFTALVNTPVQGGCADGMKQAIVNLADRLPKDSRILSTVHDEVIVEAPEADAESVRELVAATLREAMEALFPEVPIEVEAGTCHHWGEKG
jgi:DNA polymerase-1